MPSFKDKVEFPDCECIEESRWPAGDLKAIRVAGVKEELVWFPYSTVDDDSEVWKVGTKGTLIISEWIAKEKKLI